MKTPLFSPPKRWLLQGLITLLTGIGCAYPLLLTLGIPSPLLLCAAAAAGTALAFGLLDCIPRLHALSYPLLLIATALLTIGLMISVRNSFNGASWLSIMISFLSLLRQMYFVKF